MHAALNWDNVPSKWLGEVGRYGMLGSKTTTFFVMIISTSISAKNAGSI